MDINKHSMELNKIYNEDNISLIRRMPDDFIDLTVTSPPYDNLRDYKGYTFDFETLAKELYRVTKPGGVVVWVVGDAVVDGSKTLTSYRQAIKAKEIGFNIYDVIIYEKSGSAPPHSGRYFNSFEYMFIFTKGRPKTVNILEDKPNIWAGANTGNITRREKDGGLTSKGNKKIKELGVRTNVWRYFNGRGQAAKDLTAHKHPAIFPEALAKDHIISWSNKGDVVFDPFMGSGTTAVAALDVSRNYIGAEIAKEYVEIANERIKNHVTQTELFDYI